MGRRLGGLRLFFCGLRQGAAAGSLQLQLEIADRRLGFGEAVLKAANAGEKPN